MSFFDQLQPASFRGIPFGVLVDEGHVGRRKQVHEYPFRDMPWVEDLGRKTRRLQVTGFLLENSLIYGGGDVITQREQMIGAAETKGPGEFVHPTLGSLTVDLDDFAWSQRESDGLYFEVQFTFYESGQRQFPSVDSDTAGQVADGADGLDTAASSSFLDQAETYLKQGSAVVRQAVQVASAWTGLAGSLGKDATLLFHLGARLVGPFGRYFNGGNLGGFSRTFASLYPASTTITDLIPIASGLLGDVTSASAALVTTVGGMGSGSPSNAAVGPAAHSVAAALLATAANPADGLRLMKSLAAFAPTAIAGVSPQGLAVAGINTAMGDLGRRSALASLCRAGSAYQPSSYDDAARVRTSITDLLEQEISTAGDQGEDDVFNSLRTLRRSVTRDLTARGANLAPIRTFGLSASLPAMTLANQFYRDVDRSDELLSHADPIHPLFMPASFQALAT